MISDRIWIESNKISFYRLTQDTLLWRNLGKLFLRIGLTTQGRSEKRETRTHLKLEQLTQENGSVDSETATEFSNGQMELDMRANGKIIEHMGKVNLLTLTATYTTDNGSTTKLMGTESIIILMVLCTKDIGETTCSTDLEKKAGLMAQSMKGNTWQVRNTV